MPSSGNGRRDSDSWSRVGKIIGVILSTAAALGLSGRLWVKDAQITTNQADIRDLTARVVVIEQQNHDMFYMTCVMFQKVKPDDVPSSCSIAVRPKTP